MAVQSEREEQSVIKLDASIIPESERNLNLTKTEVKMPIPTSQQTLHKNKTA